MIIHILLLLSATKNPIDLHLMSQKYRPEYDVDLGLGVFWPGPMSKNLANTLATTKQHAKRIYNANRNILATIHSTWNWAKVTLLLPNVKI